MAGEAGGGGGDGKVVCIGFFEFGCFTSSDSHDEMPSFRLVSQVILDSSEV